MSQALKTITIAVAITIMAGSLFAATLFELGIVNIEPNPMDKRCMITINLTQESEMGVRIEDDQGNLVKTLYWGPAQKGLQLTWNRVSDAGNFMASGTYYVVVTYGGRYTSIKKTLILK